MTSQAEKKKADPQPAQPDQLTTRIRGRWTAEQVAFIRQLAKRQRAAASDVLRHVVAWFLAEGDRQHSGAGQVLEPSPLGLVKRRETGLQLLDFMTTQHQAGEIKAAAAGRGGEAAFLRHAVDVYRIHGPLIRQQ